MLSYAEMCISQTGYELEPNFVYFVKKHYETCKFSVLFIIFTHHKAYKDYDYEFENVT